MTATLDRRAFLASLSATIAASAVITPDRALAGATPPGWALGVADLEADIAPRALTRIAGKMPSGLAATLYRNGPAKFRRGGTAAGHWFDGDGLMRRWQIAGGQATLAARFADTPKRRLETKLDAMVIPGFGTLAGKGASLANPDDGNAANTSVIMTGGKLMALWEGGSPVELDPETLETRGFTTFRPDLKHMPFSAHPRVEPNGTVWNFGGGGKNCALWQLKPDGSLGAFAMLTLPRASYFHDFTMTARHIIIVLQPWVQDGFVLPISSGLKWKPELGTQILVIDKADLSKRRTFELPAFSFFHLADGWEESDGTIRFDGCLEADPTFGQKSASGLIRGEYIPAPPPTLTQIVLSPNGKANMRSTGLVAEFPASDRRLSGSARRVTTHVTNYDGTPFPHAIASWDWQRGRDDVHHFGRDQLVEEFLFQPRGAGERDGWLIGTTLNLKTKATELHVIDAARVSAGPVVSWRADVALPIGFHGTLAK
jgi:all-trans-8'-apo-beta-carotenal 15,15'-oxygenase